MPPVPTLDDFARIAEAPLHTWLGALIVSVVAALLALGIQRVGARIVTRIARPYPLTSVVLRYIDKPSRLFLVILALEAVWWEAPDTLTFITPLRDAAGIAMIGAITWLSVRSAAAIGEAIIQAHPLDTADNLQARRIHTQARVLARSVMLVIVIIGVGGALMTFPNVRQIGASLLASAGVAALVAGIAARPVLGNLIAGLQIALSQPIRLDDVVVIQGEWGRIEEITGTYVSVRLWDQRRLIVPLQWFIENPFANWTRSSSQIIGTVFLYVDYRMPLAPLREELARIVEGRARVGSPRAGAAGHRRHRTVDAVARAGQFARFGAELGLALPRARGVARIYPEVLSAVPAAGARRRVGRTRER
ncbi:small-conductance mechanosensitive channel [Paraburkholderia bryophila]|uniref:Small-conductance mechanosensitive channel n=1 Tax=Paraburkholderia bryophila TaxID=420952 RepID=A0A7Y9WFH9_9BURK|nr:small-conductance mechanosensitive channel [Paraburkholderia bryophila]